MTCRQLLRGAIALWFVCLASLCGAAAAARAATFAGPISSQPLALDAAGNTLAVVSPDTDSVAFFDVSRSRKKRRGVAARSERVRAGLAAVRRCLPRAVPA
jgi:hypothetical protein